MSTKAVGWALEQPLDPLPKIILIALAEAHNAHTGRCFPAQEYIAQIARCHERTVREHLKGLEAGGYIERIKRFRANGNRTSDAYVFPALAGDRPAAPFAAGLPAPAGPAGLPAPAGPGEPEDGNRNSLFAFASREGSRTRVKCQGKPVPPALVAKAERLFDAYCAATGRKLSAYAATGKPSTHLQQITLRVVENPDVDVDEVIGKMPSCVADPPSWVEPGAVVDVGDMFGPKAFGRLLARKVDRASTPGRSVAEILKAADPELYAPYYEASS